MSVIVDKKPGELYLFVKGASEMVLEGCSKWIDPQTKRI